MLECINAKTSASWHSYTLLLFTVLLIVIRDLLFRKHVGGDFTVYDISSLSCPFIVNTDAELTSFQGVFCPG